MLSIRHLVGTHATVMKIGSYIVHANVLIVGDYASIVSVYNLSQNSYINMPV